MKRQTVFSLVREQSMFMTAIMSLMTFLAVLAFGVALGVSTAVIRWNNQWDTTATIQVLTDDKTKSVQKTLADNADKIVKSTAISNDQMLKLMSPWVTDGGTLKNYLPQMWEVEFKSADDMTAVRETLSDDVRFLTHAGAMGASIAAGWNIILISGLILAMSLGAIGICISYIARNTAMLHRRELEILNQIGATDGFVARQMQFIVARIAIRAAFAGFIVAALVLLLILGAARGARVGLMAMMGMGGGTWGALVALTVAIVIFAIWITRRTTLNILKDS